MDERDLRFGQVNFGSFGMALDACIFTESLKKQFEPSDFKVFQRWINKYVNNWADCDTFCNHTVGTFIMMYPEFLNELKQWAKSSNRWTKRASAVSLIIPARKVFDYVYPKKT